MSYNHLLTMKILAIETSCDETAIAVLTVAGHAKPAFTIDSHVVASQADFHAQFGGVFPAMAKREHSKAGLPTLKTALKKAGLWTVAKKPVPLSKRSEAKLRTLLEREPELLEAFLADIPTLQRPAIDRIAITVGPGLAPALWVGINFARALSYVWDIPLVPVNHMEGHILSIFPKERAKEFSIEAPTFPLISLLVSGGHTEIVVVKGIGKYALVGRTKDDAAGEAFDKVARTLGLPYPGGPHVSRLAEGARAARKANPAGAAPKVTLPRPMLNSPDFDFSFSGLKTAVLYFVRDHGGSESLSDEMRSAIALEFENAAVDVLVKKTIAAAKKHKASSIIVGGGVAANQHLRTELATAAKQAGMAVIFPAKELSTDNAVMIGIAGYFGKPVPPTSKKLVAQGNMEL